MTRSSFPPSSSRIFPPKATIPYLVQKVTEKIMELSDQSDTLVLTYPTIELSEDRAGGRGNWYTRQASTAEVMQTSQSAPITQEPDYIRQILSRLGACLHECIRQGRPGRFRSPLQVERNPHVPYRPYERVPVTPASAPGRCTDYSKNYQPIPARTSTICPEKDPFCRARRPQDVDRLSRNCVNSPFQDHSHSNGGNLSSAAALEDADHHMIMAHTQRSLTLSAAESSLDVLMCSWIMALIPESMRYIATPELPSVQAQGFVGRHRDEPLMQQVPLGVIETSPPKRIKVRLIYSGLTCTIFVPGYDYRFVDDGMNDTAFSSIPVFVATF
ncbi:uncharacterized protein CLUP02_01892 [Colletotrichum lupini]|uniref:Uncharacterized protein n=1 Tax=Colletotrichum lupini TaxID=145971 RepID=A0A9Q8SDG8_9PEZI|nr:uncharacterized protein CLUP02_01892 [Colletotrichum lupini]UQC75239.1 hypothetical protein CLUP02_01892 [Colletotrichum lupini]